MKLRHVWKIFGSMTTTTSFRRRLLLRLLFTPLSPWVDRRRSRADTDEADGVAPFEYKSGNVWLRRLIIDDDVGWFNQIDVDCWFKMDSLTWRWALMAVDCAGDEDMMAVESVVDDEGLRSKRLALTSKSQHFMSIRIWWQTASSTTLSNSKPLQKKEKKITFFYYGRWCRSGQNSWNERIAQYPGRRFVWRHLPFSK